MVLLNSGQYCATCASDRVVLGRVQSYRLIYTDARPSLCVHSILGRLGDNIYSSHVHPLGTCDTLPLIKGITEAVCLTTPGRPALLNTPPQQLVTSGGAFRTNVVDVIWYRISSFRLLNCKLWLSTDLCELFYTHARS